MFLNPLMLFGISAISVPIIIHLLNRRKFERVQWAAMRFLRVSVEQNQRRLKLEDLLLLILRCILVALLAIALARPVIRAAAGALAREKITAVLVVDNSYSMSQTNGVQSRFDAAKKASADVLRTLPTGSAAAVLLASDVADDLIPEPTFDLTYAAQAIEDAPIFDRPSNLLPAIQRAEAILHGRSGRKEVYVITDGQAAAWRRLDDIVRQVEESRKDLRMHLLFVKQDEERNLGISVLRLDSGIVPVNVPVRIEVQVRNYGREEAQDVSVSISVDGEPSMDEAIIPSIPPGEARSLGLFARIRADGYHTITARIAGDHVPADDQRTLALRAVKDVKVLLIEGESGREAREGEVFFLRNALRPVPRAEWDDHYIKIATRSPTELDGVRFEDFDAVVAANVTDFSPAALSQLVNYVQSGRALWIFPGGGVNVSFYNEQLFKKHNLLPAMLGPTRGDEKQQETWFSLQDRNYEHPVVSLWSDPNAGTLSAARFFKAFNLMEETGARAQATAGESDRPASQAPSREDSIRVILRFSDNRPAMMERNVGRGRVVLFASSADTEWNDLGARAGIFIPLVHRTLGHLVARQDEHLTIQVGAPFLHAGEVEHIGSGAQISKAPRPYAGREDDSLSESRTMELIDGIPMLRFDRTDFAGPYDVRIGGNLAARFAAQPDPGESILESLNDEQLRTLGNVAHVVRWQSGTVLQDELEQARMGTELWLPLALIVLTLATMETLLAHWFSHSK